MKRISTLLTAVAALFTVQVSAQTNYFEDFEDALGSASYGCIEQTAMMQAFSTSNGGIHKYVINDNASLYGEPSVSELNRRSFSTPFLELTTSVRVQFNYKMTQGLATGAYRYIVIGMEDVTGTYTKLDSFRLTNTSVLPYDRTATLAAAQLGRIVITLGGGGGDGNTRVVFDNLSVNAPMLATTYCNEAPVAYNNTYNYTSFIKGPLTGNFITDASPAGEVDADPENETLTPVIVSQPDAAYGSVSMNADGTFTFQPSTGFTGGIVTFTYTLTDNGTPQLTSNVATVTINYPPLAVLPIKLLSFTGNTANNRAQLKWSVADNETGDHFKVMRSTDGKNFNEAGTVVVSNKVGSESYSLTDVVELAPVTYYKLKIVNKNGSVAYSNIIVLRSAATVGGNALTILQYPVGASLNFTYTSATSAQSNVVIYNAAGVKVFSTKINTQKGANALSFNLDNKMAPGTYILEVANATERSVTKLIKK